MSIGPPSPSPDPAPAGTAPGTLASDRDRDLAVEQLSGACADGRLSLEAYSRRLEQALAARTIPELAALIADLGRPVATATTVRKRRSWFIAIMSSTSRRGRWILRSSSQVLALMGECRLDLRQAEVESPHSHITAVVVMGSVTIVVPDGMDVEIDGIAFMGNKELRGGQVRPAPGSPTLQVTCVALMGEVQVRVQSMARVGAADPDPERLGPGDRWGRLGPGDRRGRRGHRHRHGRRSDWDGPDDGRGS